VLIFAAWFRACTAVLVLLGGLRVMSRQPLESRTVGLEGYTSKLANKRLEFTHEGKKQETTTLGKSEEGRSCLPWHLPVAKLSI
jgi:hypothetical protein